MLKGITITLYDRKKIGEDPLGKEIYEETPISVENVLIAPAQSVAGDIATTTDFEGKKAQYILAIPKEDLHEWEDRHVKFFGKMWKTIGIPQEGIEKLIPLMWNKKVLVERCE